MTSPVTSPVLYSHAFMPKSLFQARALFLELVKKDTSEIIRKSCPYVFYSFTHLECHPTMENTLLFSP